MKIMVLLFMSFLLLFSMGCAKYPITPQTRPDSYYASIKIINPCIKKETDDHKGPCPGSFRNKHLFKWRDQKYSMNIIRPNPNIDPEIVKNAYDHCIDYKLRMINPYAKREVTGSKEMWFGSFRQKFQPQGKRYETPISGSAK